MNNFFDKNNNNNKILCIIIFLIILGIACFFILKHNNIILSERKTNYLPSNDIKKMSDFELCTHQVAQADCYVDNSEEIIFYWKFNSLSVTSEQEVFEIQVADNVDFEIPTIESGKIISKDNNFSIQSDFLENNKEYFWRVKVKDNKNYWSDWVISGNSFKLSPSCLNN